jgi:CHAD domain-containing protein
MADRLNSEVRFRSTPMTDAAPAQADLPARIAAFIDEELRAALDALGGATVSDQDVHNARKSLKKARGGLRLCRPAMADEDFQAHNLTLRDAGRLLSPLRDGHSQLHLFRGFEDDTRLPGSHIESALHAELSQARHTFDTTNARQRCTEMIAHVREALDCAALGDADACIDGLCRIYRKGRRALTQARRKNSAARRHELRKQAKYLRVALEVIDAPDYLQAQHLARRIASWLGEDHDLAVLRQQIERSGEGSKSADERWIHRIEERQDKLQRKAFAKAEIVFEEKPKGFAANLRNSDGN